MIIVGLFLFFTSIYALTSFDTDDCDLDAFKLIYGILGFVCSIFVFINL